LDESDEILNVAYQLVYTSGSQSALEDHPDRWTAIQEIFTIVKRHAVALHMSFPDGVELHLAAEDGFPATLRILEKEAGDRLVHMVGEETLRSMRGFHLFSSTLRDAALRFITNPAVDATSLRLLEARSRPTALWNGLLLRRGILAGGILIFALQKKRYRVDYGLDLTRTMLAVPYRAKDVPSPRADFGHPDVALSLTCLRSAPQVYLSCLLLIQSR
jgi:hypothetical protein